MPRDPSQPAPFAESAIETGVGRLFRHGRSQAVRLPKAFRMEGDRVRITRHGHGLLLEPEEANLDVLFAELRRLRADAGPFPMREQAGWEGAREVDLDRADRPSTTERRS